MKYLLLCWILLCGLSCPSHAEEPYRVMTEELPPFNFSVGDQVVGISTEIVRGIFRTVGCPMEQGKILMYPWARAYHEISTVPRTALFSMARTAEREELFLWVGPLQQVTIGLIAKKNRHISISTPEDLREYHIGTVRDGAPEQLLIQAGVAPERLERLIYPQMNIRKLAAGRIDLFAFNVQTTRYLMLEQGIDPKEYETVYLLKRANLYLALHRDSDPQLVGKLQDALDRLKQPGPDGLSVYERLVRKYLQCDSADDCGGG